MIDFVMELFGVSFQQAIARINFDFNLGLSGSRKTSVFQQSKILQERREEQKKLDDFRRVYQSKTVLFREMWLSLKLGIETPLYFMALRELPILENWFEENPWR